MVSEVRVVRWHVFGLPASRASRGAPFVAVMEMPHGTTRRLLDYGRQCVRSDKFNKGNLGGSVHRVFYM